MVVDLFNTVITYWYCCYCTVRTVMSLFPTRMCPRGGVADLFNMVYCPLVLFLHFFPPGCVRVVVDLFNMVHHLLVCLRGGGPI